MELFLLFQQMASALYGPIQNGWSMFQSIQASVDMGGIPFL